MERLTRRSEVGEGLPKKHLELKHEDTASEDTLTEILDTLADYEDLEEQGLLIKLPCKAGDVVYRVSFNAIYEDRVAEFAFDDTGQYLKTTGGNCYKLSRFGKTIFLNREEAEKKLIS